VQEDTHSISQTTVANLSTVPASTSPIASFVILLPENASLALTIPPYPTLSKEDNVYSVISQIAHHARQQTFVNLVNLIINLLQTVV
jgi:hypothetical protein